MFAATYTQDEELRLEEVDIPNISDDEMLLRVIVGSREGSENWPLIKRGRIKAEDNPR